MSDPFALLARPDRWFLSAAGGLTIDPFPFGWERAEIGGVRVRWRTVGVRIDGEGARVTFDHRTFDTVVGQPVEDSDSALC
jgi:hypothetical protein